jgi:hypothetical protein
MVGLLRELVEEVRELKKAVRGMSGLGVQIYQQSAKLVWLGERQSYLAEKALRGSGSRLEAGGSGIGEVRKDKGKGKGSEVDETMKSDGGSDSGGGSEEDSEKEGCMGFGNGLGYGKVDRR